MAVEVGPRGKKVVAYAPDWPGLERGAATEEAAVEKLRSYIPRYAKVAKLAHLDGELGGLTKLEVAERYPGTGSTDFWGISFAFSKFDKQRISPDTLQRELALMRACWKFFDGVRSSVSSEMRKGPRGGGRDRDRIARHVMATEQQWSEKLGLRTSKDPVTTDEKEVAAWRNAYCAAIKKFHSEGRMARTWPLRFLIRHTAFHTMDHAWEMEDKDLTSDVR